MKALIPLLSAALCLTALVGCAAKGGTAADPPEPAPVASPLPADPPVSDTEFPPEDPGTLEVVSRQGSVEAWRGSYSWDVDLGDGTRRGIEADAAHPLDVIAELPVLRAVPDTISRSKPQTVSLLFSLAPESVSVVCWDASRSPRAEEPGERVEYETREGAATFDLREGDRVYMITAVWKQPEYEGLAYFAFRGQFLLPSVDPAPLGTVFSLCPAEDSCGTLFSAGAYFKYAADSEAFWALFGLERDELGALQIP